MADQAAEYREKLLDAVVETDEALMERYLDGQELDAAEVANALKDAVTRGEVFPVACGVATKNLGTHALLDLLVEGVPSPAKKGAPIERRRRETRRRSSSRRSRTRSRAASTSSASLTGAVKGDATLANPRTHSKERLGALMVMQGKEHTNESEIGEGDLGAVAKLKETQTGDLLLDQEQAVELPSLGFPEPVMSFAITPKAKGDEEKMASSLRRLAEEDPTLDAPPRRADGRAASVGHVADARRGRRRPAPATVRRRRRAPPAARPVPGVDPRKSRARTPATRSRPAGAVSSATARSCWSRSRATPATSSRTRSSGASSRRASGPRSTRGSRRRCCRGELAGAPVSGVRVRLVDGSYHTVDSSEMAFKIAGSMAFKQAYEAADPVLLEPIMEVEITVPDDAVGAVNGDLNSRRGRLLGMEPKGGDDDDQAPRCRWPRSSRTRSRSRR